MRTLTITLVYILSLSITIDAFAAVQTTTGTVSIGNMTLATSIGTEVSDESESVDMNPTADHETMAEKKDKEKTINDINTFLIESYKIKIDRVLANLNTSLERITNNDSVAQAKLLEKIRSDISMKIQIINSRSISENRKKILSSVFSYIQENLDTKISKLVGQK